MQFFLATTERSIWKSKWKFHLQLFKQIYTLSTIPNSLSRIREVLAKQYSILTRAPKTSIIQPSWLPIEDSRSQAVLNALHRPRRVTRPFQLAFDADRDLRLTEGRNGIVLPVAQYRPICFDHHHGLAVLICQRVQ